MRQLPSDINDKINQSLQTIGNDADPKMQVLVARAKNPVADNTYWTVETIREIGGLGDVSVAPRRFDYKGPPNRIYEIHVRDGIVYTSIREYPDKLKSGFVPQFSLGPGVSVGVAFNGDWKIHRKKYRLVTEDKPFITWVDTYGVLWVQKWDEESTKFQLASGVTKAKMIRGWKNLVLHDQDHGVVVAYIKTNGKVYYRNYCTQSDYTEAWEYEKELLGFAGIAVNINLFITNDYRMGFIIEDNAGKIHWLVTYRNWGGMASPAENLVTGLRNIKLQVLPIAYHEFKQEEHIETSIDINRLYICPSDTVPKIIGTERLTLPNKKTIKILFNYELECELSNLRGALTLQNTVGQSFTIDTVMEQGNMLTITTIEDMPFSQNIILKYNMIDSYYLAFRISGNCLYKYENNIDLLIEGIPPVGFFNENLSFNIVNPNVLVTQVYYSEGYLVENLKTNIQDINIIVTNVGDTPL